jgi:hypothetical protein
MREQAESRATGLAQQEAHARETEAQAAEARALADRKAAEAERLESEAYDQKAAAAASREEHEEALRRADEIDPDVDHRDRAYDERSATGAAAPAAVAGGTHVSGAGEPTTHESATPGEHSYTTPGATTMPPASEGERTHASPGATTVPPAASSHHTETADQTDHESTVYTSDRYDTDPADKRGVHQTDERSAPAPDDERIEDEGEHSHRSTHT